MQYVIKVDSPQASETIQQMLFCYGWQWQGGNREAHETHRPFLCLNFDDSRISWSDWMTRHQEITVGQLIANLLSGEDLPVKGCRLGEYDAVLVKDDDGNPALKVGCQTVTLEQARAAWELLSGEKTIPNVWAENTWLAMDRDGEWYIYHKEPVKQGTAWVAADPDGKCFKASRSMMILTKCEDWEKSLIRLN